MKVLTEGHYYELAHFEKDESTVITDHLNLST